MLAIATIPQNQRPTGSVEDPEPRFAFRRDTDGAQGEQVLLGLYSGMRHAYHARMAQPPPGAQTPFGTLTEALGGLLVGHCLTSVTNFRVADALGDTPQTAAELAAATGTNPEALRRMLRLLAAHGVFASSQDRFAHTAASQLLRADHPWRFRPDPARFRDGCGDGRIGRRFPARLPTR